MKRLSLLPLFLLLAAALGLGACMSVGNNINESRVSEIKKGRTTEADLVQMFGPPNQRGVNSEGETTMEWTYVQANVTAASFVPYAGAFIGGTQSANKRLKVRLQNGRVADFAFSGGGTEMRQNRFGTPGGQG